MILIENKVVIDIMDSFEKVENGFLINGAVYCFGEIVDVNAADDIVRGQYCYTIEKGFYINPVWLTSAEGIKQTTVDELMLELLEGGLI